MLVYVCVLPDKCVRVAGSGEGTIQILPYALLGHITHPQEISRK